MTKRTRILSNDGRLALPAASTLFFTSAAFGLTGCAGHGGGLSLLMSLGLLAAFACSSSSSNSDEPGNTAGGATTGGAPNASGGMPGAGGGSMLRCCENGVTSSCFCPGGSACNFSWDVTYFNDGSCCRGCSTGGRGGAGGGGGSGNATNVGGAGEGGDGGVGGVGGGTFEKCCEHGVTALCFCPAGEGCNFGLDITFHKDGTCCDDYDPENCVGAGGAGGKTGHAGAAGMSGAGTSGAGMSGGGGSAGHGY